MALYDFVCMDCGSTFEVFVQGFIKDDDKRCPECGSHAVRQKFTSFLRAGSASSDSGCAPSPSSAFR
jgi:putative FmdB family regulatory protein